MDARQQPALRERAYQLKGAPPIEIAVAILVRIAILVLITLAAVL